MIEQNKEICSLIPILLLIVENNSHGGQGFIDAEDAVKKIFEDKMQTCCKLW